MSAMQHQQSTFHSHNVMARWLCAAVVFCVLSAESFAAPDIEANSDALAADVVFPAAYAAFPAAANLVTNGPVLASASFGSSTGKNMGHGAAIDLDTALVDPRFPKVTKSGVAGQINAIVGDGLGGWVIGGDFTHVGGIELRNLAYIQSDLTVSSDWRPNPDGVVHALRFHTREAGLRLLVGGEFTEIHGETRWYFAELHTGSVSKPVTALELTLSLDGFVYAIATIADDDELEDRLVYIGGAFTTVQGTGPRDSNGDGQLDVDINGVVGIDMDDDGIFEITKEIFADGIYDIDVDGDGDIDIDVNGDGNVDQTIDVKYDLSGTALDTPLEQTYPEAGDVRQSIVSLDLNQTSNGMVVREWNPNVDGPVKAMVLAKDRGRLFIGGDFENIAINVPTNAANDVARQSIAELDVTTNINVLTPWNPGETGAKETTEINVMLLQEFSVDETRGNETELLYVGGDFERIGGQDRDNFAVLDIILAVNNATSWDVDFSSGVVTSLAQTNDTVYVGGEFTEVEGDAAFANLAGVLVVEGTLRTGWNPKPVNGTVMALAIEREGDVLIAGGKFTSVEDESQLYIGGDFTYIGPSTGSGVVVNATGGVQSAWPEIDGDIYTVISDDADGWYIGGSFSRVGAVARNNIAYISYAGVVNSTWNPDADAPVRAMGLNGSNLYVGGDFSNIGGQVRSRIALVNTTTGAANVNWDPNANDVVRTIAVSGSDVYVGGDFTLIGSQSVQPTRNYAAHFDLADTNNEDVATAWNPNANDVVRTIAVSGTNVYVGGDFTSIGAEPTRNNIALINTPAGTADVNWIPNADGIVRTIAISVAGVYVGGDFANIGGQERNNIAFINTAQGAADPGWNPDANGVVRTLLLDDNNLYVGGDFTFIGRLLRNRAAAFNLSAVNNNEDVSTIWNPSVGNTVYALSPGTGTSIFIGGAFSSVGGVTRERLAAIDSSTGILSSSFNTGSDAAVRDMVLSADGETLYVGGDFTSVGGQSRNHVAALKTTTGSARSWNPDINGSSSTTAVHDIELSPNERVLYVAGEFETIGSTVRNNVGAIDVASGDDTGWNPSVGGVVYTIALNGDTLFIGGDFANVNTNSQNIFRSHLAALNITQDINNALAWAPAVDGPVYGMVNAGSTLYIGGDFRFINDGGLTQSRDYLAALDTSANAFNLLSWNPRANGLVEAITLTDDVIFVGGDFTEINNISRERMAALDFVDGAPLSWWDLRVDATVRHLGISRTDDRMIIGGDFKQVTATITPMTTYLREGLTTVDVGFPRVVTNPPAGAYKDALETSTLTVSCIDVPRDCSGSVYYTINSNVTPDPDGLAPDQEINISVNTTLQLIVKDDAGNQSEIQTMLYVIDELPPTTTALPSGPLPDGKILSSNDELDIVLDCVDAGNAGCAEIYYTVDGTKPTDTSTVYTGPITLSQNTTLKYFAFDQARNDESNGGEVMDINVEQYWLDLAAPIVVADPPTQIFYTEAFELTLLCSDDTEVTAASIGDIPDASNPSQPDDPPVTGEASVDDNDRFITGCRGVYYTLDDSTPTTASTLYTGPIRLSDSTVVKFIAVDHIGNESIIQRASYVKNYSENAGAIGPLSAGLLLLPWLCWRFRRHRMADQMCRDRGLV
ncbi:MAG: chitobiase/beta-hexosaminidase C-terminal domain-containing protein [Gammaproteobacteria bacterium]|nr:chitobiase/beta-hexosaminidase C-terminal domain-containing protein [Gammaproteobacteria bacterium]